MTPGNPLASVLRATRDHLVRLNPKVGESRDLSPYPLLLGSAGRTDGLRSGAASDRSGRLRSRLRVGRKRLEVEISAGRIRSWRASRRRRSIRRGRGSRYWRRRHRGRMEIRRWRRRESLTTTTAMVAAAADRAEAERGSVAVAEAVAAVAGRAITSCTTSRHDGDDEYGGESDGDGGSGGSGEWRAGGSGVSWRRGRWQRWRRVAARLAASGRNCAEQCGSWKQRRAIGRRRWRWRSFGRC